VSEQVHDSHSDVEHSASAPSNHGAGDPAAADAAGAPTPPHDAPHSASADPPQHEHAHGHAGHEHTAHEHAGHEHAGHEHAPHSDGGHEAAHAHAEEEPAPAVAAQVEDDNENAAPIEEFIAPDEPPNKRWYILKVQSNREDTIREGLQRRVAVAGLDRFFGDIIVPTEMVSEFKGGKKRVVKRKLYPGYLVVHMEINEDTWFLVRETPGIGDFTGSAGKPSEMSPQEVNRIIAKQEEKSAEAPKLKIDVKQGDRVKINEGTFENFEGEVDTIDEANGRVTVMINIFGRSTPVELEYWQIEKV
jgi:transcriptional antiterminator NusG